MWCQIHKAAKLLVSNLHVDYNGETGPGNGDAVDEISPSTEIKMGTRWEDRSIPNKSLITRSAGEYPILLRDVLTTATGVA